MTVKHNNAFINLLFCKLQDVLILTTCFGHRMTIIRSTRAIIYPLNVQCQKHVQHRIIIKILHCTSTRLGDTPIYGSDKNKSMQ